MLPRQRRERAPRSRSAPPVQVAPPPFRRRAGKSESASWHFPFGCGGNRDGGRQRQLRRGPGRRRGVDLFTLALCPDGLGGFIFDATLSYISAFQSALAFNLLNLMLLGLLYFAQKRRTAAGLPV